ncbi:hypothetical protein F9U64_09205 [Gracilibacillus oryzae]|uniref:Prepilin-type N-terminal cleavage/methylation domain-containing protein n=1 Tax=Gracilibacillus oryzae TaxID=1672701 RepID=A0A7C8GTD2_9BACI|nr:hypothetical protein [Gracilibacillus oryzae]KAB8137490.1 hypothetical protein F9U64_09205 [Gracilibacillus oryzae]
MIISLLNKYKMSLLNNERGLTLAEILASILILSIIVVTFTTFFINSAKSTSASNDITDATYLAQTQMEEIYHMSAELSFSEAIDRISGERSKMNGKYVIKNTSGDFQIKITIATNNESSLQANGLKEILVQVYNSSNKLEAQMESKYLWEN